MEETTNEMGGEGTKCAKCGMDCAGYKCASCGTETAEKGKECCGAACAPQCSGCKEVEGKCAC